MKIRKRFFIVLILVLHMGCATEKESAKYLRWVGDIEHDEQKDDADFKLCNGEEQVKQYFNFSQGLQYAGEKKEIIQAFKNKYKPVDSQESGWIRIRFIVNCKGETGRFRLIQSNDQYQVQDFDQRITSQLFEITKGLEGWKILPDNNKPEDYYQYLVFKITDGNINEILP